MNQYEILIELEGHLDFKLARQSKRRTKTLLKLRGVRMLILQQTFRLGSAVTVRYDNETREGVVDAIYGANLAVRLVSKRGKPYKTPQWLDYDFAMRRIRVQEDDDNG